jgi:hypothetical protein
MVPLRVVSCEGLSHPGLTALRQLRSVVNLILESTRAIPSDVSFRWHATFQPTCMGGCYLCAQASPGWARWYLRATRQNERESTRRNASRPPRRRGRPRLSALSFFDAFRNTYQLMKQQLERPTSARASAIAARPWRLRYDPLLCGICLHHHVMNMCQNLSYFERRIITSVQR